jgi:hypothetical protein
MTEMTEMTLSGGVGMDKHLSSFEANEAKNRVEQGDPYI